SEPIPPLAPEYHEYEEFLARLTSKDREQRFATAAEVMRALKHLQETASTAKVTVFRSTVDGSAPPPIPPTKPRLREEAPKPVANELSRRSTDVPPSPPPKTDAPLSQTVTMEKPKSRVGLIVI